MASRWYRLPETGSGDDLDEIRPDLLDHADDVDGWSGNAAHPDGAPQWIVRVYGDDTTLDALAGEPQAVALDGVPVQALNEMLGQDRDADGWREGFRIGVG